MQRMAPLDLILACLQLGPGQQVPLGMHARASAPAPEHVRFAVIGDFGVDTPDEAAVSALVHAWAPDFVLTVGDNNYPLGQMATIDANIGRYYHDFIGHYAGGYGAGSAYARFFPCLGNHDWYSTPPGAPYLGYFTLPGNERYYELRRGPVALFALDSDVHEPDGIDAGSPQAQWLQARLAASDAPFRIVYFHHPAFSSGPHGPTSALQWPFAIWGADLVLQGHDHLYERFEREIPYLTDGIGGQSLTGVAQQLAGSEVRFAAEHGALLFDGDEALLRVQAVGTSGTVLDERALFPDPFPRPRTTLLPAGSIWKYADDGVEPPAGWSAPGFDDSAWSSGAAQLGYGDGDEATLVDGGPPLAHFVSTWFRTSFTLADPNAYGAIELELLRDDGARVFVNGVELVRSNLPAGPIDASTLALAAVTGSDENAFTPFEVPRGLLVAGSNTIAAELHQSDPASSDLSFDLRIVGTSFGTPLVAAGSTWKYKDDGLPPPADWSAPAFSDAGWSSGPAQLGYGEGDEATQVQSGPPLAHHPTTWFRRSFQLPNPALVHALELRLLADDGADVFLNGVRVLRRFLPQSGVGPGTWAGCALEGPDERRFVGTLVDPRLLVAGTNVLAVEVHQVDAASDDLSFDLELYAR